MYTSSSNGFVVTTSDFNTFDNAQNPPSVFQLRMKVQDGYSTTATATVYDYFNVEIKYQCDDDVITLSSDITMYVYSTSSGVASTINANFAQTISGCAINYKAEVYDGPVGSSGFSSITTSTTSSWLDITSAAPNADLAWR